jgi:hypothetical protein
VDFFGVCVLYSVRDVILVILYLHSYVIATAILATHQVIAVYSGWKSVDNYDTCASVFVVLFNGFMSLTSYFDVMYRY